MPKADSKAIIQQGKRSLEVSCQTASEISPFHRAHKFLCARFRSRRQKVETCHPQRSRGISIYI